MTEKAYAYWTVLILPDETPAEQTEMPKKTEVELPDIRNVGYARVSTEEQNLDMQLDALRKAGVLDDNLHSEHISGAAKNRPALDMAIMDLRPGDTFIVWRLDRLARSMRELYARLDQIYEAGAGFKSLSENFDFSTAIGKLYLAIAGAFAEFERQLAIQRTKAGMQSLRDRGFVLGRAQEFTPVKQRRMLKLIRSGRTVKAAAKSLKISPQTFYGYYQVKRKRVGRKGNRRWKITIKKRVK